MRQKHFIQFKRLRRKHSRLCKVTKRMFQMKEDERKVEDHKMRPKKFWRIVSKKREEEGENL